MLRLQKSPLTVEFVVKGHHRVLQPSENILPATSQLLVNQLSSTDIMRKQIVF